MVESMLADFRHGGSPSVWARLPLSTHVNSTRWYDRAMLSWPETADVTAELDRESVVDISQVVTLDKRMLDDPVGRLDDEIGEIDLGLRLALELADN